MTPRQTSDHRHFSQFYRKLVPPDGGSMKVERFQHTILRDYFAGVAELVAILPKKNGKTSLLAGLAVWHLLHEDEADILIVANSSKQAMKLFDEARGFIMRTPGLREQLQIHRGIRELRRRIPGAPASPHNFDGLLYVAAADADTADGWGGTLALVDELHRAKSSELYGVIRDGLSARSGQMITISTAGETMDSPLGNLRAKAYSLGVKRNGAHRYVTNGAFSLHEWALEATDDLDDLELVKKANPAPWIDLSVLHDRRESPNTTPAQWARMACGVWGVGSERAFDMEAWDGRAVTGRIQPGRLITLGWSAGRVRDAAALVACDVESGLLQPLGIWQSPGYNEEWEVPEPEVDDLVEYAFDQFKVWRLYGNPPLWESALDRWAGKYGQRKVVRWWTNQTRKMGLALLRYRTDIASGALTHDGDEMMRRHMSNSVRRSTKMMEGEEPLSLISKPHGTSDLSINGAIAGVLAWTARGDAIASGEANRPTGAVAAW